MPGTTRFEQKGKKKDQTGADLYSKGKGRHKKMMGGMSFSASHKLAMKKVGE